MSIKYLKFYDAKEENGFFSNFYSTEMEIDGELWQSVEQYFQAMKFRGENASKKSIRYSNIIKNASTPMKVKALGNQRENTYGDKWKISSEDSRLLNDVIREYKSVKIRDDWENVKIKIMIKALMHKFLTKEMFKKIVKIPDDVLLVEHTTRDKIWADGGDGGTGEKGENCLGKILTVISHMLKYGGCQNMSKALKKAVKIKGLKSKEKGEKTLKIVSWNINGLRSNVITNGKLKVGKSPKTFDIPDDTNLGEIIKDHDPDIICFQETRCSDELAENIRIKGFYQYWNGSKKDASRSGNRYSGVAVWTKIEPLRVLDNFPDLIDEEGRFLYMEFEDFSLLNIYTPNAGSNFAYRINQWDPAMNNFLKRCHKKHNKLIICGDFNIARTPLDIFWGNPNTKSYDKAALTGKAPKAGYTREERKDFEEFLENGYIDVYRHFYPTETGAYTWWNPRIPPFRAANKGWRIDYFVVADFIVKCVKDIQILRNAGLRTKPQASDHAPLMITIDRNCLW